MSLLQMSFSGGIMILVVIVIRMILIHQLPKKTFLALWFVCILRLLIPFSIPSAFSVYTLLVERPIVREQIIKQPETNVLPVRITAPPNAMEEISAEKTITNGVGNITDIISVIWLIGAGVILMIFGYAYIHCVGHFRESLPISNTEADLWLRKHRLKRKLQICSSSRIDAPLTYGVMSPVILVPRDMDWSDDKKIEYMLTHEYTHIRRFDALRKLLLIVVVSVHWFNPMAWIMFILANRDIELACDEDVLGWCGLSRRSDYARMLVHMQERKCEFAPQVLGFSRMGMEERITAIMKTKRNSVLGVAAAIAVVTIVGIVFATSANASVRPDHLMEREYSYGTQEDYDSLFALRPGKSDEYNMEEFRSSLVDWVKEDYSRSERVREDVVRGDFKVSLTEEDKDYLVLTYVLLGEENARQAAGLMAGGYGGASWIGNRKYDDEDNSYYAYVWERLYYQFLYRIENEKYVKVDSKVYDDRYGEQPELVKVYWSAKVRGEKRSLDRQEILAQVDIYAKENEYCIKASN